MFSPLHEPNRSTVSERTIRTVIVMARCMIISVNAPRSLAREAITYAVYIINRLPTNFTDT